MSKYRVYYDPEDISEFGDLSPYNLKKDVKNISEEELERIATEVGNEIHNGLDRSPISSPMFWGISRKSVLTKIRVVDVARNSGKSNGYRCITLVDTVNECAYILHIYRHAHGEDKDIDKKSKNKLKKLLKEYETSLKSIN